MKTTLLARNEAWSIFATRHGRISYLACPSIPRLQYKPFRINYKTNSLELVLNLPRNDEKMDPWKRRLHISA